jgi:phage shock protein A
MARLSLRDRFFSPPVAKAMTSPSGILALGAGAALGILTGGGAIAAVVVGALAYAGRVGLAIPRNPKGSRIDPFTLSEPWRHYVRDALQAHTRFREAVEQARTGPTQDRLRQIDERVDTGVQEVWRIACRGHELVDARRRLDPDEIRREIAATEANASQPWAKGSNLERTMESLDAQLRTVERLERVIGDADSRLRLLNARLDEAAARGIELSVQASSATDLGGLGHDVDSMVEEMEALRQAIEETEGGAGTAAAGAG